MTRNFMFASSRESLVHMSVINTWNHAKFKKAQFIGSQLRPNFAGVKLECCWEGLLFARIVPLVDVIEKLLGSDRAGRGITHFHVLVKGIQRLEMVVTLCSSAQLGDSGQ